MAKDEVLDTVEDRDGVQEAEMDYNPRGHNG